MNEQKPRETPPYKMLGSHLKYVREQLRESVAEVSGAVEIDEIDLKNIERGQNRPSEDILLLLINHYNVQDQEAVQLWELAGYESESAPDMKFSLDDFARNPNPKALIMLMAMDMRIMYSDGLDVNVSPTGLTLTFTQAGGGQKRSPVGRIGMSHHQAAEVIRTLQIALNKAEYLQKPRGLPGSSSAQ